MQENEVAFNQIRSNFIRAVLFEQIKPQLWFTNDNMGLMHNMTTIKYMKLSGEM